MFEQKKIFYKLFSSSKIIGAIKDIKWRQFFAVFKQRRQFIQRPEEPFNYLNF